MSFIHSDASQSFREDCAVVSHDGKSSQNQQHTNSLSCLANCAAEVLPASERTPLLQPPPPDPGLPADDDVNVVFTKRIPTCRMFREELWTLAEYSLPIIGTNLAEASFFVSSVIAIGHVSTVALAATTLASMTASVTGYTIEASFSSALDTLLPPAWTSDKPHMVGLWTQRMALFMLMNLVPIIAIWLNAEPILLTLNQEPEVARLAGLYLRCSCLGLPAYTFNSISRRYFQSQGLFSVPTRITLLTAPLNAFLNWFFVYPLGLSFPGAPLATALSFNIVSVAFIFYGRYCAPQTAWSPITRESLNPTSGEIWKGWGVLAKLGFAGIGQIASEWWSWEIIGFAASQLGPISLASQSVVLMSGAVTYQVPFALSAAASVRIGNLLGEGNARRARVAATTAILVGVVAGCAFGLVFLVFRNKWGYLFNDDIAVVKLVASVLPVIAVYEAFDAIAAVTNGIFRARGKQVMAAFLNLSAYYVLGIPIGLYLAFWRGRGIAGLWDGMTVGLVYCAAVGVWSCIWGADWKAESANARSRVAGDE